MPFLRIQRFAIAAAIFSLTCDIASSFPSQGLKGRVLFSEQDDFEQLFPVIATISLTPDQSLPSGLTQFDILGEERTNEGTKIMIMINGPDHLLELQNDGYEIDINEEEMKLLRNDILPYISNLNSFSTKDSFYSTIFYRPCYRDLEGTYQTMFDIVENDERNLASLINIGPSYLKANNSTEGYDLFVLKLTNHNSTTVTSKAKLFIMSGLHAREMSPVELTMRFAEMLLDGYGVDADITQILDHTEVHLLLHANPDGRYVAETEPLLQPPRRKNMNFEEGFDCEEGNYTEYGVDLNRNFPYQWGGDGASTNPCSLGYRGKLPESEPEVQAIIDYVEPLFPVEQRRRLATNFDEAYPENATGFFFDLHAYSELTIWPYYFTENMFSPNHKDFEAIGRKFKFYNNYTLSGPGPDFLYPASGNSLDWAYGELGCAAFSLELGTAFYQDCETFEDTILPDNIAVLRYAAKIARAPYSIPKGPDVLEITLSSSDLSMNSSIYIEVTVSDSLLVGDMFETGSQDISSVHAFIDEHPYDDGSPVGIPMEAIDEFDSDTETAVLELFLSDLEIVVGKHMLHIQATDSDGYKGPVSSVYFNVDN